MVGVGALLALGALAGGGSGDDEDPPSETPVANPGTVTLTVISDLPSAE